MRNAVLLATGAALALAACQQSDAPAPAASDTATAEASEAAAPAGPAAFAAGQPPSAEFLVGTWGEGDACELPITFAAGGKITDGPADTWTLEDGQLVMGDMFRLRLTVIDGTTMESLAEGSDEPHTLKRCG
jgi:hypothetical protein